VNARKLGDEEFVANSKIAGATPMWQWAGDDANRDRLLDATVIGY